jgi:hypothetical protein
MKLKVNDLIKSFEEKLNIFEILYRVFCLPAGGKHLLFFVLSSVHIVNLHYSILCDLHMIKSYAYMISLYKSKIYPCMVSVFIAKSIYLTVGKVVVLPK